MAFKDDISYETISQINKKERKSAKLVQLDPDFYSAIMSHLKDLKKEYNKRHSESPTSTETLLLNSEIYKLDGIIKDIYSRRERKILLSALDKGAKIDVRRMLKNEQRLFETIVKALTDIRRETLGGKTGYDHVLAVTVEPEKETGSGHGLGPGPEPDRVQMHAREPEPAAGSESEPEPVEEVELEFEPELEEELEQEQEQELVEEPKSETGDNKEKPKNIEKKADKKDEGLKHALVHVLEDIEPFVGTDLNTYKLHKEDVVTVPEQVAQILMKKNKVRIITPAL